MHAMITTLLPIGAAAVIAKCRFGVQQRGRDRAERVEDHLRHEEPEQERREVPLLGGDVRVRRAARQQAREQRREHDAEHRDRAHHRDRVAEQPAREPVGLARRCRRRSASRTSARAPSRARPPRAARTARSTPSSAASNVLPRYVVPSTAAITSTRTKPIEARHDGHAAHAHCGARDRLRLGCRVGSRHASSGAAAHDWCGGSGADAPDRSRSDRRSRGSRPRSPRARAPPRPGPARARVVDGRHRVRQHLVVEHRRERRAALGCGRLRRCRRRTRRRPRSAASPA